MTVFEVALIPVGEAKWAALLSTGQVILTETKHPRVDVAIALLQQGCDPRSEIIIRQGARIIAHDLLGMMGGNPVTCNDIGVIEKD